MKEIAVVLGILAIVLIIAGCILLGGFVWMVCLGSLAHIFGFPNLAINYPHSILVGFIVSLLLGGLVRKSNN